MRNNIMIMSKKIRKMAAVSALLAAGYLSVFPAQAAQECTPGGSNAHMPMTARVDLSLSGTVKKNDKVGEFLFNGPGYGTHIANCGPDSEVYGYATYGEGSGTIAKYYGDIDGNPAYHVSPSGVQRPSYVYVLTDTSTGTVLRTQPGARITVPEGRLEPLKLKIKIYAAVDNPPTLSLHDMTIGAILLSPFDKNGGTTRYTYSYLLRGTLQQAPVSCNAESTNLEFRLPRAPVSAFREKGFPDAEYSAEDNLTLTCTGDVSAKIKLLSDNTADYNGKPSVVRVDNEGRNNNSSGIGFVVTSPLSDETPLISQEFVKLADLNEGTTTVPLKAHYYRYGNDVSAGKAEATAQFVLQFN